MDHPDLPARAHNQTDVGIVAHHVPPTARAIEMIDITALASGIGTINLPADHPIAMARLVHRRLAIHPSVRIRIVRSKEVRRRIRLLGRDIPSLEDLADLARRYRCEIGGGVEG